jgi:hypothetical protein
MSTDTKNYFFQNKKKHLGCHHCIGILEEADAELVVVEAELSLWWRPMSR